MKLAFQLEDNLYSQNYLIFAVLFLCPYHSVAIKIEIDDILEALGADHLIRGGLWFFLLDQTFFSTPSLNIQFFSDLIKSKKFFSQR